MQLSYLLAARNALRPHERRKRGMTFEEEVVHNRLAHPTR